MRRRRKPPAANHDRWLVSYADFITLLFAFFVVLFAPSHADLRKAKSVSEAVKNALTGSVNSNRDAALSLPPELTNLQPLFNNLLEELQPEMKAGKMQVRMEQRGVVVSLNQATFFPSGEDALDPQTLDSIGKVATAMRQIPNPVRLEGHTDSIPIHTSRFNSNWDLSAARAIAVMTLLQQRWGIAPGRLAITGYAETVPLQSNDTAEGRARNRRVDIVILNAAGVNAEPDRKRS